MNSVERLKTWLEYEGHIMPAAVADQMKLVIDVHNQYTALYELAVMQAGSHIWAAMQRGEIDD